MKNKQLNWTNMDILPVPVYYRVSLTLTLVLLSISISFSLYPPCSLSFSISLPLCPCIYGYPLSYLCIWHLVYNASFFLVCIVFSIFYPSFLSLSCSHSFLLLSSACCASLRLLIVLPNVIWSQPSFLMFLFSMSLFSSESISDLTPYPIFSSLCLFAQLPYRSVSCSA